MALCPPFGDNFESECFTCYIRGWRGPLEPTGPAPRGSWRGFRSGQRGVRGTNDTPTVANLAAVEWHTEPAIQQAKVVTDRNGWPAGTPLPRCADEAIPCGKRPPEGTR